MSGEMLATELPKALGATKARSIINAQIKARNTELKNADKKVSKSITEEVKQEAKRQTIREEIKRLETALMGLTKSNVPMMQKT